MSKKILPDTGNALPIYGSTALIRFLVPLASTFLFLIVLAVCIPGYITGMKSLLL